MVKRSRLAVARSVGVRVGLGTFLVLGSALGQFFPDPPNGGGGGGGGQPIPGGNGYVVNAGGSSLARQILAASGVGVINPDGVAGNTSVGADNTIIVFGMHGVGAPSGVECGVAYLTYYVNETNNALYVCTVAGAPGTFAQVGGGGGTGDVVGPASSTNLNVAVFSGTDGKLLADGGKGLPTGAIVGTTDSQTLASKTLTTPTIGDFTNAGHTHQNAAGGGTLDAAAVASGSLAAARNTVAVLDDSVAYCSDGGASDAYACNLSPAPAGYVTGARYRFRANTANTTVATINFNSLGAVTIKTASGGITTDLSTNDIRAGQDVDLVYDGTNMQMQSTSGNAVTIGQLNVVRSNTWNESYTGAQVAADSGLRQFKTAQGATIVRISCSTDTGTVDLNIDKRVETTPNTAGTNVLAAVITCDSDTQVTTTFSSAGLAVNAPNAFVLSNVTGSPTVLRVHVNYNYN